MPLPHRSSPWVVSTTVSSRSAGPEPRLRMPICCAPSAPRHGRSLVGVAGTPVATAADDAIVLDLRGRTLRRADPLCDDDALLLRPHLGEDIEPNRSVTLDVDQLVQPVPDLDQ